MERHISTRDNEVNLPLLGAACLPSSSSSVVSSSLEQILRTFTSISVTVKKKEVESGQKSNLSSKEVVFVHPDIADENLLWSNNC